MIYDYICPTVPKWDDERNSSYGYNHQFLGNARMNNGTFYNFTLTNIIGNGSFTNDLAYTISYSYDSPLSPHFGPRNPSTNMMYRRSLWPYTLRSIPCVHERPAACKFFCQKLNKHTKLWRQMSRGWIQ